jgi:hypothetical protein
MKKCSKCELEKDSSQFKRWSVCIECNKISNKKYNDSRKEKMKEYYLNNRDLLIERSRENYSKNKDKDYIKERNKKYQEQNRENRNNYINERKKYDNLFKLSILIRKLIYISIKKEDTQRNQKLIIF